MCLAIPGEIIRTYAKAGVIYADARFGGVTREVCLALQPDAGAGDFVRVHVGFAIAKIDRERAEESWAVLRELAGDEGELTPEGVT